MNQPPAPAGPKSRFLVEESLVAELRPIVEASGCEDELEVYRVSQENWVSEIQVLQSEGCYSRLLLPGSWLNGLGAEGFFPPSRVRLGFWACPGDAKCAAGCYVFPEGTPLSSRDALLRAFIGGHRPGVHSFLPKRSRIFSDRLVHPREIGRKLDQASAFLAKDAVGFEVGIGAWRLALTALQLGAFDEVDGKAPQGKPLAFQVGLGEGIGAFSVRWSTPDPSLASWSRLPGFFAEAARISQGVVLRVFSEASEIEITGLFCPSAGNFKKREASLPEAGVLALEVLSNERLACLDPVAEARVLEGYTFSVFAKLPLDSANPPTEGVALPAIQDPGEGMVHVKGDPGALDDREMILVQGHGSKGEADARLGGHRSTSVIETNSLKLENARLSAAAAQYKSQVAQLTKNMAILAEREKKAQRELRGIQLQSGSADAPRAALATTGREIEILRGKLDAARQREAELVRKLTRCIEELRKAGVTGSGTPKLRKRAS